MGKVVKYGRPEAALRVAYGEDRAPADLATAEVAVMQTIVEAVATLPEEVRGRVLHWAAERFGAAAPSAPAASPVSGTAHRGVTDLAVGDLSEFFSTPGDNDDLLDPAEGFSIAEPAPGTEQPVVSMIHGFVEEFQRLARAWESA